jgi:hypothetical protein
VVDADPCDVQIDVAETGVEGRRDTDASIDGAHRKGIAGELRADIRL